MSQEENEANNIPPSFTPSNSRMSSRGEVPQPSQLPTPVPPSFAPSRTGRAIRGSSNAHQEKPVSYAPKKSRKTNPSSIQPVSQTRALSQSSMPSNAASSIAKTPRPIQAKPHRVRNRCIAFLLVVLIALGVSAICMWNWVNSNLNKSAWLTATPNSSAQTWLILGSDKRDGTTGNDGTTGERTDTILVLTKPKKGPNSLISIPRDSLVEVDGQYSKINAVLGLYGQTALVREVESITGQKINHVAKITFGGLAKVVDALGGVTLCYNQDVDDPLSGMKWQSGCHTVQGQEALAFSRMRYSDPQGDFGRTQRQRQLIGAISKKAASPSVLLNPGRLHKVAQAALDSIDVDKKTNPNTLLSMVMAFKAASGSDGVTGSLYFTDPDYYVDGIGSCVLLDDAKNTQLFNEIEHGTHKPGTVGGLQ